MSSRHIDAVSNEAFQTDEDFIKLKQTLKSLGLKLWLENGELRCGGNSENLTDSIVAQLKQWRAELISELSQKAISESINLGGAPLSFAQQRLWFLEQVPHEVGVYHVPLAIKISGQLDTKALEYAVAYSIRRHEILRTRFPTNNGEPFQDIINDTNFSLPIKVLQQQENQFQYLTEYMRQFASKPFDLINSPPLRIELIQLTEQESVLLITLHHILCDGWSLDILINEISQGYRAHLMGGEVNLQPLQMQYSDFARWQRQRLSGSLFAQQVNYWRQQLALPPVMEIPTDFPRPKVQSHDGDVVHFDLPQNLVDQLQQIANQHSATLFMTLLAAFKLLLSRYCDQWDVVIGTPVTDRQSQDFEGLIGLFINTLVLRTRINKHGNFSELLQAVRRTTLDALAHQDVPFEQLIDELKPERDMSRNPLFQIKFLLEKASADEITLPGIKLEQQAQTVVKAKHDLSLNLYETDQGIVAGLEYNTSLFKKETMEGFASHFTTLLHSIVEHPQRPLANLPVLNKAQQEQQLSLWNQTRKPFQETTCFHHMVEHTSARYPEDIAVIYDDGQSKTQVSYRELNNKANQLAWWLKAHNIGPEKVVAICMDRSVDMMVSLLAVLKAGGAYLPLDANYPQERLVYMLEDSAAEVLLSHSGIELPEVKNRLDLDCDFPTMQPQDNPPPLASPDNLAYVIYTSGSTGLPKGVQIQHRGLVNLTEDKIRKCQVAYQDCVLQFFSFSFDASIPEIIMPWAVGASLLVAPAPLMLPGPDLSKLMIRNNVSHITMTPSALVSLPDDDYPDLKMVLVGGEAPSPELINKWNRGRIFINAYGPTETTVNASMVPCGNGNPLTANLLPSANKQLYILDSQLELMPIGAIGELYIGGEGLARGYLNRPDLTAKQFIPNPFHSQHNKTELGTGDLLYKTGDLAYFESDGRIRLVGRADFQVKIRGFRVELGDIEHCLAQHPEVEAVTVIAFDHPQKGKVIAAFAVPSNETTTAQSAMEMRRFVGESLPAYMVPSSFRWLESLPLTPNDKIDTKALIKLAQIPEDQTQWVPPRNQTEIAIANVFADILELPKVGLDTDFFDAGGHSLLATKLVSQLLELFAVEITVIDLFEATTVAGLAQRIEHKLKLARLQNTVINTEETEEIEL